MKSNEKKKDVPGCQLGTHPMIIEDEEFQIEQASLSRQSIALPVCVPIVIVIYEPLGLSNLITMGIKTSKA